MRTWPSSNVASTGEQVVAVHQGRVPRVDGGAFRVGPQHLDAAEAQQARIGSCSPCAVAVTRSKRESTVVEGAGFVMVTE